MPIRQVIQETGHPVKIWTDDIDASARQQLLNLASLPFIHHHVAAMPDVHTGIGATVGSVIATRKAIIPAAVGVDIGCGMAAVRTSLTAGDLDATTLRQVFDQISRDVPVGFDQHRGARVRADAARPFSAGFERLTQKHPGVLKGMKHREKWASQMGTLGGGNHFIEVCLDEVQRVWVMLHSGSRGIGNAIGHYFIERAREDMRRHFINLPDRDLAYFPEGSAHFDDYIEAVGWAHGAGRRSRTQAGKRYTEADLATRTEGVVCRKDRGVIDEIPAAYKDIDEVMANQTELVEIVHTLKQVVCVKG